MKLQQLAGGDGKLNNVGRYACWIGACGNFCAAAIEGFQLEIVQGGSGDNHVIARIAVLRFGEGLDDLRRGQLVGDLGEVERVAAGRVVSRKRSEEHTSELQSPV